MRLAKEMGDACAKAFPTSPEARDLEGWKNKCYAKSEVEPNSVWES